MAYDDPKGFIQSRNLAGNNNPTTRFMKIAADGRSGQFAKYSGDPVVFASGQYVARMSADNSGAYPLVGVIRCVYTDNGRGLPRPLIGNQPNNGGPYLQSSVAGIAEVYTDPNMTYRANTDTTLLGTHVGQFVGCTVGSYNTNAGRSGMMIKLATATNAANGDVPFQIIGVAATERDGLTQTEGNQDVEVRIAHHAFSAPFVGASAAIR